MTNYERLARDLLVVSTETETELVCQCQFHEDRNASLWFNKETGLWFCFACQAKGNAKGLAWRLGGRLGAESDDELLAGLRAKLARLSQDQEECPCLDVYSRARAHAVSSFRTNYSSSTDTQPNTPTHYSTGTEPGRCSICSRPVLVSERYLRRFHYPTSYWESKRDFTPGTIEMFNLGFDPVTRSGTIPYRTHDGLLLGTIKRFTSQSSRLRYLYPKRFPRKETLFGSWLLESGLMDKGTSGIIQPNWVVLTEGSLDCVKVWQSGLPAVAMLGSSLSIPQTMVMRKQGVEGVVIFTDGNDAGYHARDTARSLLQNQGFLTSVVNYPKRYLDGRLTDPGCLPSRMIRDRVSRACSRF